MYRTLFILFLLAFITSCGITKDDDKIQKARLSDLFKRIEDAFREDRIDAILSHYHENFLHDGFDRHYARYWWIEKRVLYHMIEIDIINIQIDEMDAKANIMIYFSSLEVDKVPFPGDIISYFYHERGVWRIYGNQERHGE